MEVVEDFGSTAEGSCFLVVRVKESQEVQEVKVAQSFVRSPSWCQEEEKQKEGRKGGAMTSGEGCDECSSGSQPC